MYRSPRMSDGRSIARPTNNTELNDHVLHHYNVQSNWDYRKLLQNNGLDIMKHNFKQSLNQNSNYVNPANSNSPYKSPYIFNSVHEVPSNANDLKLSYLSNQSTQARLISPSIPTNP